MYCVIDTLLYKEESLIHWHYSFCSYKNRAVYQQHCGLLMKPPLLKGLAYGRLVCMCLVSFLNYFCVWHNEV